MKVGAEFHKNKKSQLKGMGEVRDPWWRLWRELADFYLPSRYRWLMSPKEQNRAKSARNPYILDDTGTKAARILAAGMMSGVTSPSRPWFRLRVVGFEDDANTEVRAWLDEVVRRLLYIMAESNFYKSMAILYLDLAVFGTGVVIFYEDSDDVIRCYNPALGEFYLAQDHRQKVNRLARRFCLEVHQLVEWFDEPNCSQHVRNLWREKGAGIFQPIECVHMIEPNIGPGPVPKIFPYRELYWEYTESDGNVLAARGLRELAFIASRWEQSGNDIYGTCPGMDGLGDVIQLQQETLRKGQALDFMVRPSMLADIRLQHRHKAQLPGGLTYVENLANAGGMRPAYEVNPPLGEIAADILDVQARVRETFHNDLFRMISQLETVRSATEIDARREEKLILLGSVLDRFESEALDPAIDRIYAVANRRGLLPPPPPGFEGAELEIQYVSIMSAAQNAYGVIPIERWLTLIGNVAPMYPKAVNIPDFDELIRNYGRSIGVPASGIRPRRDVDADNELMDQLAQEREASIQGQSLVDAGKTLSETDVGGGANALQRIISG